MDQANSYNEPGMKSEREVFTGALGRISGLIKQHEEESQGLDRIQLACLASIEQEITNTLSQLRQRDEKQRFLQLQQEELRARRLNRPGPRVWSGRPYDEILSDLVGTNELMEMILSHTHHRTLVAARSVSKHVCALIDTSPVLQRRLFLLPDYGSETCTIRRFPNGHSGCLEQMETDDDENPIGESMFINVQINAPFLYFAEKCGSTWKRMLVTQPPIKVLHYYGGFGNDCRSQVESTISCKTGITLGQLFDITANMLSYHQNNCGDFCDLHRKKWSRHFEDLEFVLPNGEQAQALQRRNNHDDNLNRG